MFLIKQFFIRSVVFLLITAVFFADFPGSFFLLPHVDQAQAAVTTEGMVLYGKTGNSFPSYKLWTGSSFGTEQSGNSTDAVRWVKMQGIPRLRDEKIAGVMGGGQSTLYVQRWNGSAWSSEWNVNLTSTNNRTFDVAYEQFSGVGIVVYGDSTTQLKYRKWDGVSWSGELNAGSPLDSAPYFVQAVSRPPYVNSRRNDISVIVTTSGGKLHVLRWNASAWGDQIQMATNPAQVTSDVASIVYERTTGDIMVIWGTSGQEIRFRKFTTSWQAELIAYSGLGANASWLSSSADRLFGNNNISVIWNDSGQNIQFGIWNGTSWETRPTAVATDQIDRRNVDTVWEKYSGKAIFAFGKKSPDGKALSWRTWTSAGGFSIVTQESSELSQKIRWIQLQPDAKSNQVMGLFLDIGGDLSARRWNGSAWDTSFTSVVVGVSSANTESFDFFWDDTAAGMRQQSYRWYVDNNQVTPTDAWPSGPQNLGENASITFADLPPASTERLRLRIALEVQIEKLVETEQSFKLQFSPLVTTCAAIAELGWIDVGAIGSAAIWRGFNGTPVDGTALSTNPPAAGDLKLSISDRAGTYEESNDSALNPFQAIVGEEVEYDWVIEDNGAAVETNYCFRMVDAEGFELSQYPVYPQLITSGYRAQSQNWRWYNDEGNETPTSALAAENVAPTGLVNENIVKLRLTLKETAAVAGSNVKFKLQYSGTSDFASDVNDLVAIGSCTANSLWCYGNGVDVDNDAITTRVITDSTSNGTHNETGTSTSTLSPAANSAMEMEFTIKHAGARAGKTYYFRAYNVTKGIPVPINTGELYASLKTQEPTLSFTVSGLPSGTSTEGIVTDVTTTATTIPFGNLPLFQKKEAAIRLSVSTNATDGYRVLMRSPTPVFTSGSDTFASVSSTNASPGAWGFTVSSQNGQNAGIGYHTSDATLSTVNGAANRFSADDTWAQVESATFGLYEVAYSSIPVTSETTDIIFRLEAAALQDSGNFSLSNLVFIVVPFYY